LELGLLSDFVSTLSKELKIPKESWLSIYVTDDNQMRTLNSEFLNKKNSTDVLAFGEEPETWIKDGRKKRLFLGEVIVNVEAALSNSKRYETTPDYELCLYIIHGILHLLGFSDTDTHKRALMEKKQKKLLDKMNIKKQQNYGYIKY